MECFFSIGEVVFDIRKATQVAAYLLWKRGGEMSCLKLMKLMYLAEKQFLLDHGERLTGDKMVSMPMGLVLSAVYDCFTGGEEPYWNSWMTKPSHHDLALNTDIMVNQDDPLDTFDELFLADQNILDKVFSEYGKMNRRELVERLQNPINCPEWEDPQGSSYPIPIPPSSLLIKNGKTKEEADAVLQKLAEEDDLLTVTQGLA